MGFRVYLEDHGTELVSRVPIGFLKGFLKGISWEDHVSIVRSTYRQLP